VRYACFLDTTDQTELQNTPDSIEILKKCGFTFTSSFANFLAAYKNMNDFCESDILMT